MGSTPLWSRRFKALLIIAGWVIAARAEVSSHPWLVAPPKLDASAYITNLKSGAKVASPFVVKFGMRYWGVAPVAHPIDLPLTGHFHLLVDTPLPSPIEAPIPFNKNYIHFGKGQMEAVVDLPPGDHTLRVLLANREHVPYFVYSDLVTVTVTERNPASLPPNYGKIPRLEILNLKNNDVISPPFVLRLHASGLNVAPSQIKIPGTGFFQLKFENQSARRKQETIIALPDGLTEAWLDPPPGSYNVQLRFVENATGAVAPVQSDTISFVVRAKQ